MTIKFRRKYVARRRAETAEDTRRRVLEAARRQFSRRGIDKVTIAEVAAKANVGVSTVYALFKSKDGLLQAIMQAALFGAETRAAQAIMDGVEDAAELIVLTAKVARAIYESEGKALGLMRGASAFSPTLRRIESRFETLRLDMQTDRVKALFAQRKAKPGLTIDEARRLLWMYTSRDIYRMLVQDGGWSVERYEQWLAEAIRSALLRS